MNSEVQMRKAKANSIDSSNSDDNPLKSLFFMEKKSITIFSLIFQSIFF